MTNDEEIWKIYPDYDFIEVSNLGRVRTKDRTIMRKDGKKLFIKGHMLKQWLSNSGYLRVMFSVNGKRFWLSVHRMVAITFIPNSNDYPEVNHIDCERTNNRWDNLEWCTRQYNTAYRDKMGHTAKHNAPKKPVIAINQETSEVFLFESQHEAARQLKVNVGHLNSVLKGWQKTTGGCWFTYANEKAVEKTRTKFGEDITGEIEKLINDNCNF